MQENKIQKKAFYNQTKLPMATALIAIAATPNQLLDSGLTPALVPAVNCAVLREIRPVGVIPFNVSATSMAGPTLKKSTKTKVGLPPHSELHCTACVPNAPVVFVAAELVVSMSETAGTVMPKAISEYWKWFIRDM